MGSANPAISPARPSSNPHMASHQKRSPDASPTIHQKSNPVLIVSFWSLIWVLQASFCWSTGYRDSRLQASIEKGVSEIESRERLNHDPAVISQKRESQRSTSSFWRTIWKIGDYALNPFALFFRLWAIPLVVSATALVGGRLIPPEEIRPNVSRWMILALPRPGIELLCAIGKNSSTDAIGLNLILPDGNYPAILYQSLAQLDFFWLTSMGFTVLVISKYNHLKWQKVAIGCTLVTLLEWSVRIACALIVGAGIHETLIPAEPFQVGKGPGP